MTKPVSNVLCCVVLFLFLSLSLGCTPKYEGVFFNGTSDEIVLTLSYIRLNEASGAKEAVQYAEIRIPSGSQQKMGIGIVQVEAHLATGKHLFTQRVPKLPLDTRMIDKDRTMYFAITESGLVLIPPSKKNSWKRFVVDQVEHSQEAD